RPPAAAAPGTARRSARIRPPTGPSPVRHRPDRRQTGPSACPRLHSIRCHRRGQFGIIRADPKSCCGGTEIRGTRGWLWHSALSYGMAECAPVPLGFAPGRGDGHVRVVVGATFIVVLLAIAWVAD